MDIRKSLSVQQLRADVPPCTRALDAGSWIECGELPGAFQFNFDELWALHPEEYGKVVMYGRQLHTPRWQQSYIRPYTFSGVQHAALPLPEAFQPFLDWAQDATKGGPYNSCLINWYADGEHYIGPHRDDERELQRGAGIMSISLGAERVFRIKDALTKGDKLRLDLPLKDRTYLIMYGAMQRDYTHEVPKISGKKGQRCGKRINITFRRMK
jgi:alkylated DNA repair dioxygenase AlkB